MLSVTNYYKMQITNAMKYCLTSVRMATIKNIYKILERLWIKGTSPTLLVGM